MTDDEKEGLISQELWIDENLQAYVVCPGLLYGCGESTLLDSMKASWLQRQTAQAPPFARRAAQATPSGRRALRT